MLVAPIAKMQGPQRAVAAQSQLFEQDDEGSLALPYRRLFAGSPGQHEVLDGDRARGAPVTVAINSEIRAWRDRAMR